ncbi:acyltransferase [Pseudomonas taeanensis MS-3]|jgi:1-acyl-sn-glycerol-3-phosphate acyltransferase|uniref:Acyltransferase n=1 Tax=Pseudomonas taeanensis MS-3 TaxID=1395571 RepID=A0A0A1YGZ2_9PSED|nr:acyltransferase [Pseudomonas taeanensis]KFX68258.1 acyltransferase [Pseudomonas taeanensis MS-3]
MLSFLPGPVRGTLAALLLFANTLIWCWFLFIAALVKLCLPFKPVRKVCNQVLNWVAEAWITCNSGWMWLTQKTQWDLRGREQLKYDGWYLVTSNHQSWVDILALQHTLNRRMPFFKFFLKQELIWVPVIGLCWWALDFPFMKRYSKAYLAKHPEKKGQDTLTTRKACEKFRDVPVAVFNFLEGTRFTQAKHDQQNSPFRYLLKPKAGGIAFVLDAMGSQLKSMVNITIHYPAGSPSFWAFLCGDVPKVVIRYQLQDIPQDFLGKDYHNDEAYRLAFQQWINQLWQEKDATLAELHRQYSARP